MKKKNTINLVLSAFLIIAFIICTYFFSTLNQTDTVQNVINALVTAVFGLILFYATRVGDGKPVKRFSLATLIILDLPALYIILTSLAPGLPLGDYFGSNQMVVYLAGVALGYGIPYTFLSGFEIVTEEEAEGFIEGGIMEEINAVNEISQDVPEEEVIEEETEETAEPQSETADTQEETAETQE
ncbi:MAG: hypothetical protein ACI4RL_03235 [Ruminococcus sp.]